ncbi:hypothetical protein CAEBREN_13368 [Caenorhabditis brenneri]|uniref:Uncharacterized protein n=1 Tax=Caenorhabditis brenneri TaxID=135651 RepID=G0P1H5_CAEBE|nr:hypothetical protein CAEBREN_13368 [Caenorhabditis brenneri]
MSDTIHDSGDEDYNLDDHAAAVEESTRQLGQHQEFNNFRREILLMATEIKFHQTALQNLERTFKFSFYFESTGLPISDLTDAQLVVYLGEIKARREEMVDFICFYERQRREDYHPAIVSRVRSEKSLMDGKIQQVQLEIESR